MNRFLREAQGIVVLMSLIIALLPAGPIGVFAAEVPSTLGDLVTYLPTASDVPAGMTLLAEGQYSLQQLTATFTNSSEAESFYRRWGWEENAYRIFTGNAISPNIDPMQHDNATMVDTSLNRFATPEGALLARDYTATMRAAATGLYVAQPTVPDDGERIMLGSIRDEYEVTTYLALGTILIRVTTLNAYAAPAAVTGSIIHSMREKFAAMAAPTPTMIPSQPTVGLQVELLLPETLPLDHAACFQIKGEGIYDFPALVERFPGVPNAGTTLQALGWEAGAYRQFGCDSPPPGSVGWIDMSVHRFRDAASAAEAVPFFASSRALGTSLRAAPAPDLGESNAALTGPAINGTEYTIYVTSGPLLFRVTGVAPQGDPRPDVESVTGAIYVLSILMGPQPTQIPPAPAATVAPTLVPLPVPTATLTATPMPTFPPPPTATPSPIPTATAAPTATPLPSPPPTRAPEPTATPRVVHTPDPSTLQPTSLGCTVVELYPGYPGYRGYVTGVDGPGEVACLEELIANNPGFDKEAVDSANIAAARAIGLSGMPVDWTWENWMAIEAERGLLPTCYSCLFTLQEPAPERETAPYDSSDPRLMMGGFGTTEALSRAAANAGIGPNSAAFFIQQFGGDHALRAFIGETWPGHHSAPEMLEAYDILFAGYAEPGSIFFDPHEIWALMLSQGGYAPTPPGTAIEDQIYMIRTGIEGMCAPGALADCMLVLGHYNNSLEAAFWQEVMQSGPDIVYAEWLRDCCSDYL